MSLICGAVIFAALPGYVSFAYLQDRKILADRGVQVDAWVVEYDHVRRGSDIVVVRPDDPPYFEATLSSWPGRIAFNDRLDVVFDPLAPGRIAAVDAPLVTTDVLLFAGVDVLALLALVAALAAAGELLRRAWARLRGARTPTRNEHLGVPTGRTIPLAAWETPQIVLLMIVAPILGAAIFGPLTASSVRDAAALRTSGVVVEAVVVKSTWNGAGELDVRFSISDGTKRSAYVTVGSGAYYEGDSVDIIYEPAAPENARLAGPGSGEPWPGIYATTFVAFLATAAVTVPTAIRAFIGRNRADVANTKRRWPR